MRVPAGMWAGGCVHMWTGRTYTTVLNTALCETPKALIQTEPEITDHQACFVLAALPTVHMHRALADSSFQPRSSRIQPERKVPCFNYCVTVAVFEAMTVVRLASIGGWEQCGKCASSNTFAESKGQEAPLVWRQLSRFSLSTAAPISTRGFFTASLIVAVVLLVLTNWE